MNQIIFIRANFCYSCMLYTDEIYLYIYTYLFSSHHFNYVTIYTYMTYSIMHYRSIISMLDRNRTLNMFLSNQNVVKGEARNNSILCKMTLHFKWRQHSWISPEYLCLCLPASFEITSMRTTTWKFSCIVCKFYLIEKLKIQ